MRHIVTKSEVMYCPPSLADPVVRSSMTHTVDEIAAEIVDVAQDPTEDWRRVRRRCLALRGIVDEQLGNLVLKEGRGANEPAGQRGAAGDQEAGVPCVRGGPRSGQACRVGRWLHESLGIAAACWPSEPGAVLPFPMRRVDPRQGWRSSIFNHVGTWNH